MIFPNPTPLERTLAAATGAAQSKAAYPASKSFALAILGGVYIALAGFLYSVVTANGGAIPFGLSKLIGGAAFSLGLILVVVAGAELFTGSTVLTLGLNDRSIGWTRLIRNWSIVLFGNLVGSLAVATLVFFGKAHAFGGGAVAQNLIQIASHKTELGFLEAFSLGILCNLLVCLALWMAMACDSIEGKILSIVFPITAFVACGFEHSVANLFFLPMGWAVQAFGDSSAATAITWIHILSNNLLPVTLGNIVGGTLVWQIYRFAQTRSHA